MQEVPGKLTFDTARNSRENEPLAFSCSDWACTGPSVLNDAGAGADIQVTEVWIRPDNRYCFEVVVGGRNVANFSFDDLASATTAANAMRRLAPAVSAVLIQVRTGTYKRDVSGLDSRKFW
jgi:hypothetical protein